MKYLVWGTGDIAEYNYKMYIKFADWIQDSIIGFVDNDENKWGTVFHSLQVYAPTEIQGIDYDAITIWVKDYETEIKNQLKEMGILSEKCLDIFSNYKKALCTKYAGVDDPEINKSLNIINQMQTIGVYHFCPANKDKVYHEALWDENAQMHFIFFERKKMYLKRSWNEFIYRNGKKYINYVYGEQDLNSPHLYEEGNITVLEGDVLIDAGACEGNFSLHNIEKVSKLYLVESDPEWTEALKYTFEPYKDKVIYIDKFLSDHDDETSIKIDTFVKGTVNFIKMDIEGEEVNALKGAEEVLQSNTNIRCAICAYHRHNDEMKIKKILGKNDFEVSVSKGYMLFHGDPYIMKNPELRRGIVRGIKNKTISKKDIS